MGAGAFVGRVGALAVALGIGAAVFGGVGVASADTSATSGTSGSASSASGASTSGASTSGASTSDKSTSTTDKKEPSSKGDSTSKDKASTDNTAGASDPTGPGETSTSSEGTAASSAPAKSDPKPKKNKKPDTTDSSASTDSASTAGASTKSGASATDSTTRKSDPPAKPSTPKPSTPKVSTETASTNAARDTSTTDPSPSESTAPKTTVVPASAATVEPTPTPTAPAVAPADTVVGAITEVATALLSPFAGDSPTAPVESPLSWMATAAARKEFDAAPSVAKVADPVATAAPADPTSSVTTPSVTTAAVVAQSAALVTPAYPTNVVAIPQIPLVTALGLQNIPIVGPLFVTPIVAIVNSIPIVSDLLHPIFGYPVQAGLPAGSPQARDVTIISFDGTPINVHFMPAAGLLAGQKAPTILNGPGLGQPGATNIDGTPLDGILQDNLGLVGIGTLRDAGYNVVTWDPRGEYFSGGTLELDSPDYEARDVSSIISWIATQPDAQLDTTNDPRIGMVGVSYGGGIQLVTAATDHRVDAIVPTIAWNTLNYALYPNQAFKTGWGTLLTAALLGTFARPDPAVYPAAIYGDLTGSLTQAQQDLLAARGPGGTLDLVGQITAPALFIQGTVDTLFPLSEANLNETELAQGVPSKVIWFCGGHGLCTNDLLDLRDGAVIGEETLAWLDRYVKGNTETQTGPQFQWVDQRGQYYSANTYPVLPGTPVVTSSSASQALTLLPFLGGSGPLLGVLPIGGTRAFNAINLTVPAATATTYVVGAPQLSFTYSGTGTSRFVYAQLVDDSTGLVLGNQVTPVPVTLNGQTQSVSIPLNMVAATLNPGQSVTLQLVAWSADYATLPLGQLTVSNLTLSLPTADPSAVTATTVV